MKSLAELEKIKEKTIGKVNIRKNQDGIHIAVGMADCGIAAGAREVVAAIAEEISNKKLLNVTVTQTDCIGKCDMEPIVEVMIPGKEKVTYAKMTPEKALKVIDRHIIGGNAVKEYAIEVK